MIMKKNDVYILNIQEYYITIIEAPMNIKFVSLVQYMHVHVVL